MAEKTLPTYFREYLDEKFRGIEHQIADLAKTVGLLQNDSKANHECITSVKGILENNGKENKQVRKRVNTLFYLFGLLVTVLIVHFMQTGYSSGGLLEAVRVF